MSDGPVQSKKTSIFLVDDHQILTDALTTILDSAPDFTVIGVAGTCATARARLGQICADILLLDVSLPDGDGLSLVGELNRLCPNMYILVLTSFSDDKTLTRAIETGVNGFVSKERPLSEVISAIRQAADGEIVMPTSLLLGLLGRIPRAQTESAFPNREALTPREREILVCLAQGMSGVQIAALLSISLMTVRTHIRNLLDKLGAHSRLEAVSFALRHGLIEPPFKSQIFISSQAPQRY
jgi:DNA-binding NarL/FixJ family response regulator